MNNGPATTSRDHAAVDVCRGPNFDVRLREAVDVDAMIEEDNLKPKDDDLISKMNLPAKAVEVDEEPKEDRNDDD